MATRSRHWMTAALAFATPLVLAACATSAGRTGTAVAEPLFRQLFEAGLSRRDSAAAVQALTPTVIFHASGQAFTLPREQVWALSMPILHGFPDVRFRVDQVIADGEHAAARVSFVGTHENEWGGIAATGRRVQVTEIFVCRIEAGRLAECWQEWDEHGLRRQLTAPRSEDVP